MNATLFGTAFLAVLLAELAGDKLVFGAGALAARSGVGGRGGGDGGSVR
ncbi:MAG: hypothetical protein ABJF01_04265 [bacterium]